VTLGLGYCLDLLETQASEIIAYDHIGVWYTSSSLPHANSKHMGSHLDPVVAVDWEHQGCWIFLDWGPYWAYMGLENIDVM
jgi:hypothetical protein